jgi:hypothetical protein
MLIRTSAPVRQIERMLDKRNWRRRLAARQTLANSAPAMEAEVSQAAVIELGLARKRQLHRPARAEQAVNRAPAVKHNLRLRVPGHQVDESPVSPH